MLKGLKAKLTANELTIGSWITLGHSAIAEIMAGVGFDWLVVDLEHSVIELGELQQLIQAAHGKGTPIIARLTSNDENQIKRVMDAGAQGIMVPLILSPEDAQRAVKSVYYPPRGHRGVGLARAAGYGASFPQYRADLEKEGVVVVMIEHVKAVERIDDILSVDGVDAFIVGPYDLSASMGRPGDIAHPDVQAALEEVRKAGERLSKPGGLHVVEPDLPQLKARIAAGFKFLGYALDIRVLDSVLRRDMTEIGQLR